MLSMFMIRALPLCVGAAIAYALINLYHGINLSLGAVVASIAWQ